MRVPLAGRRTLRKERHLYCQKNKHLSIYFVIILLHLWVTLSVPYVFFFLCTHLLFSFCFSIICSDLIFGIFSITTHYKIIIFFVKGSHNTIDMGFLWAEGGSSKGSNEYGESMIIIKGINHAFLSFHDQLVLSTSLKSFVCIAHQSLGEVS